MGMNLISHLVLELGFRKENNEYVVQVSLVRFGSSSVVHYSFLALPSQYHHHTIHAALVRKHWFNYVGLTDEQF